MSRYFRFLASGLFLTLLVLLTPRLALAPELPPLCDDVTCEPNPGSSTYAGTFAARPLIRNARGLSSSVAPPAPGSRTELASALAGSESYNYAIPILSLPGRNGLDLNLTLYYNSRLWTVDSVNSTVTFNADRDFPSYGFRLGFGYIENNGSSYLLTEPDGSKRQLVLKTGTTYETVDSSYIDYNSSSKILRRKDGTQWEYEASPSSAIFRPKKIKDTNGNYIDITYVNGKDQEIEKIKDTLGREIIFVYTNGKLTSITQGSKTHATFAWSGTNEIFLNYNFDPALDPADSPADDSAINVIKSCAYPNGTSYQFTYGDWGIITQVQYKSSSSAVRNSVSYNYPTAATQLSDHPTFTEQTVFDGINTGTWTYSVAKAGSLVSSFAITTPTINAINTTTTTNLDTSSSWQRGLTTSVTVKTGGTTLRTVANTWVQDNPSTPVKNARVSSVTTTLNDTNQQSKVELWYYAATGNLYDVLEYDFGPLLRRKTHYDYLSTSPYTDKHILDRPTQVRVYDESGALKSRTDYGYDSGSPQTVTGAGQHDDTNYGSSFTTRGNVTSITRYDNAAAGSGAVTRTFTYDTLGNLLTAQLDCCDQRQWVFGSNHYAYPDQIKTGPAGPSQLVVSRTYDPATGHVLTSTDENNKTTTFDYNDPTSGLPDPMGRLRVVTRPDNAQLKTNFDDAAALPTVTSITPIDATTSIHVIAISDGLGRTLQQQTWSGGGVFYSFTETQYDALGRPTAVANPRYSGSGDWTTYAYDALSRITTVTPPASQGSYSYSYATPTNATGSCVTVTDPASKQSRNCSDAIGRLVRADEPGYPDGRLSGTGSVTISGSTQCIGPPDDRDCDEGSVTITVHTFYATTTYGPGSTTSSAIAAALRSQFNTNPASPVTAGGTGGSITLTAKEAGLQTNYSLTAVAADTTTLVSGNSFTATPSGSTLTGGADGSGTTPSLNTPMVTLYVYDALDDLTKVLQGVQTRTFTYDSMGRLKSAATPEANTVTYDYLTTGLTTCSSNPSNVCRRTDARGVVSTYTYETLNRLSGVSYSVVSGVATTPAVSFTYGTDPNANNKGRLTQMSDGTGTESYTYDVLGHVTQASKVITGIGTYPIAYQYNDISELTQITYPSGKQLAQSYDAIGRLTQVSIGTTKYVHNVQYNPAHQPLHLEHENGIKADFSYNSRLQLASLRYYKTGEAYDRLNLGYNYGTQNNGQIQGITETVGQLMGTTTYTYDAWSHVKTASNTGVPGPAYGLEWVYDRYGNRTNQNVTAGSGPSMQLAISTATNRVTQISSITPLYDAAGNMTKDDQYCYVLDSEGRIVNVKDLSCTTAQATYAYDGAGLRAKKQVGSTTTAYVFSGSKVIAEYVGGSLSKEYIYAGSQLVATLNSSGTPTYHHPDHLSVRLSTNDSGTQVRSFGHYPFGETWYETGTVDKWKFTSYERDSESGLDYAMFRFDSTRLGRFQSPDPLAGTIRNPQSLNRYSYVRNDPVNLVDPLGLTTTCGYNCSYRRVRSEEDIGRAFVCEWECTETPDKVPIGPVDPPPPDGGKQQPEKPKPQAPNPEKLKECKQQARDTAEQLRAINRQAHDVALYATLGSVLATFGAGLVLELGATALTATAAGGGLGFGILYGSLLSEIPSLQEIDDDLKRQLEGCEKAFGGAS